MEIGAKIYLFPCFLFIKFSITVMSLYTHFTRIAASNAAVDDITLRHAQSI